MSPLSDVDDIKMISFEPPSININGNSKSNSSNNSNNSNGNSKHKRKNNKRKRLSKKKKHIEPRLSEILVLPKVNLEQSTSVDDFKISNVFDAKIDDFISILSPSLNVVLCGE